MLTTAYYFLQVILCSAVMMGYYWLVLRNKRFHQYNRFYLLAIALLSWIVPLIKIKWGHAVVNNQDPQMFQFLNVVAYNNTQIEEKIVQKSFQWDWNVFAGSVYFLVAGILLMGMIYALFRIYRLLKTHECKSVGDIYLILTQAKGTPFSFFRYIFWNEEIDLSSESGKQILQHELTHVQEKHSFDKLFMQIILIAGWFNPFFWLIKNELNVIHEFIADRKAVKDGDTASLAQMLLTAVYPKQQFILTNPFFFSPIRRRLQMLANNTNPKFSYIRRLVVLPLLAIMVVLFAFRDKEQKEYTLSVASVVETAIEKGRQLLVVKDLPMPAGEELHRNTFHAIDGIALSRMALDKSFANHVLALNNSATYNLLVSEQYNKKAKNDKVDTLQTQLGMRYQAIARDPLNNPAKNRKVYVKIAILHGSQTGDKVWEETHETRTDDEGKYTIIIGQGERQPGIVNTEIAQINWNDGLYFINTKVAVSPSIPAVWWVAHDNYWDGGTMQLHGMPFELWKAEPQKKTNLMPSFNISLQVNIGVDVTLPPNTTAIASVKVIGAKKGEPIIIAPQNDSQKWSIKSSWVAEDDLVKVSFVNFTEKEIKILGSDYKVALIKGEETQIVVTRDNVTQFGNESGMVVMSNLSPIVKVTERKQYYYFVDSKPKPANNFTEKASILYTDVMTVFGNEVELAKLTKEWSDIVRSKCLNPNGCTSDLNSYSTYEQAKTQLDNVLKRYADNKWYEYRNITNPGLAYDQKLERGPHDWYKFILNSDPNKITVYFRDGTVESYDRSTPDGKKKLEAIF